MRSVTVDSLFSLTRDCMVSKMFITPTPPSESPQTSIILPQYLAREYFVVHQKITISSQPGHCHAYASSTAVSTCNTFSCIYNRTTYTEMKSFSFFEIAHWKCVGSDPLILRFRNMGDGPAHKSLTHVRIPRADYSDHDAPCLIWFRLGDLSSPRVHKGSERDPPAYGRFHWTFDYVERWAPRPRKNLFRVRKNRKTINGQEFGYF